MAQMLTYYNGVETIVQFIPEPDSQAEGLIGTGRTRCAPTDVYTAEVGQRIAFGRAMKDLGRHIESEGLSAVVSNKDVKGLLDKLIKESVRQARAESPESYDAEVNEVNEQPDESLREDFFAHVPDGIEKWVRDHGYRLERNDV